MNDDPLKGMIIHNGIASFEIYVPSAPEPRVIKRVSDFRRQIIMIGREDDPAALSDLRSHEPDLLLRLPRPEAHTFATNQPHKVVVVVGPGDVLTSDEIVESYAAKPMNFIQARSPRFVLELEMLRELHVVTGLPGSGRRNMVAERLRRMESMGGPDQMAIIKTATTRKPRGLTDSLYYDFLTSEQFAAKDAADELMQVATYGNVSYGIERAAAQEVLKNRDGICILLESRIDELMQLGFPVFVTEMNMPPDLDIPYPGQGGDPTVH